MKFLYFCTFVLLYFCTLSSAAFAAITFDQASTNTDSGFPTSTHDHSVTVGCSNPVIIVVIHWYYNQTVSSVTVAGIAATKIGPTVTASDGATSLEMWRRVGVSSGNNSVVVTFSDVVTSYWISARSYCGVDQATPTGTPVTNTASDNTPTVDVTSAASELVVDGVAIDNNATTLTVGAGQSQEANFGSQLTGGSSEAGAATVTMSWTLDTADYWAIIGVALKPAAAGAGIKPRGPIVFQ